MTSLETLSGLFEEFGFELEQDILEKCLDLCINYGVDDPREFVEMYVAHSVSNLNGAEPSIETLPDFERKELTNYKTKASTKNVSKDKHQSKNLDDFESYNSGGMAEEDVDDLMDSYMCNTPKAKKGHPRVFNTPVPDVVSSPIATDSPISSTNKDVSGRVVYTFGNSALIKGINWTNAKKQNVKLNLTPNDVKNLGANENYMYDTFLQKCSVAADRVFDIGQEICAKLIKDRPNEYNDELYQNLSHVDVPHQNTLKCIGRVCSDNDYQLDPNSTMLIGADEMKLRTVRLNFNRIKNVSLYPGQTVFAQGLNPRGDILYVDEIFSERQLTHATMPNLEENLNMVIASGPFCKHDELNYEPLNELIAYCKQNKPDVLILLGPFLDADHKCVQETTLKLSFETFFENLITGIMEAIGNDSEVLIVSSYKDIHGSMVYPTHPYNIRQSYKNLHFLPDPCTIEVNGVTIGISSTDILTHILDMELPINMGDKMRRAVNNLFHQASFYPLNPPSEKIVLDSGLTQNFAALHRIPNLLILPSTMKCFVRDLNNCVVINPGQLSDVTSRGTFGRVVITPNTDVKALNNFVGCQIIKI